jgi:hypothetical protein
MEFSGIQEKFSGAYNPHVRVSWCVIYRLLERDLHILPEPTLQSLKIPTLHLQVEISYPPQRVPRIHNVKQWRGICMTHENLSDCLNAMIDVHAIADVRGAEAVWHQQLAQAFGAVVT